MAVTSNDTITASQFNNLQSRIAQVLGTGSGDFGYGQPISSSQVSSLQDPNIPDGDSILAAQFNDLRTDLAAAFTHQTGDNIPVSPFNVGDIIGADESGTELNYDNNSYTFVDEDSEKGFNDLLNIMTDLEANRFDIDPSQRDTQIRESDQRTVDWNGTITSEFSVAFADSDARRHFFNAGGEIRFAGFVDLGSSTGDSLARDQGWNDLIENPGEIKFDYNSTSITGSTTGTSFPDGTIGNDSVSSSYQIIFKKDANGGTYGDSYWQIEAREDNSSQLRFRVTLVDDGPESNPDEGAEGGIEPGVTEPVTADLEFDYSASRANGSVVLPFPSFSLTDTFG